MSLVSEHVFDNWCVEMLLRYAQDQQLEDDGATFDDWFLVIDEFPHPPVGFLVVDGTSLVRCPYWSKEDITNDAKIYEQQHIHVEQTCALQHDDMCDFLLNLVQSANDAVASRAAAASASAKK